MLSPLHLFKISQLNTRQLPLWGQILISTLFVLVPALVCNVFSASISHHAVALLLLFSVSVAAILFDFLAVLLAASVSAFTWNYFFIPPIHTFHIGNTEDTLMFIMYFVIVLINVVLTSEIRRFESRAGKEREKAESIHLYNTLLNSLSHELKTPISAIIGAVDTIQDTEDRLSVRDRRSLLNEIKIAGLRLNRQVVNLLNMSRIEAGVLKPRPDWCDINELIFELIQRSREEMTQHLILFNHQENLPLIRTDRVFLEQIIQNILNNAWQHTPPGTEIEITAGVNHGELTIRITDNGGGFPEEAVSLAFDKFYRVHGSKTGGTGLGLSIARGFSHALGGRIELINSPGKGVCFSICIPAKTDKGSPAYYS